MKNSTQTAINIDQQIALKIMGWTEAPADHEGVKRLNQGKPERAQTRCYLSPTGGFCTSFPEWSKDITLAFQVVSKFTENKVSFSMDYDVNYGYDKQTGWSIAIDGVSVVAFCDSLPLAICRAALDTLTWDDKPLASIAK